MNKIARIATIPKKRIVIATLTLLFILSVAACLCNFFMPLSAVGAEDANFETDWLQESYLLGTTLEIPEVKVTTENGSGAAKAVVSFPGGKTLASSKVKLDETGNYSIELKAEISGKQYKEVHKFCVINSLYTISGEDSSASYGKPYDGATKNGLDVSLAFGASIDFHSVIDVSGSQDKTLTSFYIKPSQKGYNDFLRLNITFTDVEDSSNYLKFTLRSSEESRLYVYAQAGGAGQGTVGFESGFNRYHSGGIYGTPSSNSFSGGFDPIEEDLIEVKYNDSTKQIFINNTLVCDMDDPTFFSSLWYGFKGGRCTMSISAAEYIGSSANFVLDSLYGVDLSAETFIDTQPPEIIIDRAGYSNFPDAIVGCAYKVPEATAKDVQDGNRKVTAKVFKSYQTPALKSEVSINDRRFVPDAEGTYTIEYSAEDASGNQAQKKTIEINAKKDSGELNASVNMTGIKTVASAGERIAIGNLDISNSAGNVVTNISFTSPDGTVELVGDDMIFVPETEGEYRVKYYLIDFVGKTYSFEYTVTVSCNQFAVFSDEIDLPEYFLSGYTYQIPEYKSYVYSETGKKEVAVDIKVKLDSGEVFELDADRKIKITTKKSSGGIVTINYVSRAGKTASFTRPVLATMLDMGNGLRLKPENYVIEDAQSVKTLQNGIHIKTTAEQDNGFRLAAPMLAQQYTLTLKADVAASNFTSLDFYLSDMVNPDIEIKVSFIKSGNSMLLSINDGERYKIDASFTAESGAEFVLGVSGNRIASGSLSVNVAKTYSGASFSGFPSNYCNIRATFAGVSGNSAVSILRMNNQSFNSDIYLDLIKPQIIFVGDYGGTSTIGTTYTTPLSYAFDVLSPNVSFYMSVKDPDGEIVKDTDGLALNNVDAGRTYQVVFEKYGYYTFAYYAEDEAGNLQERSFTVNIPGRLPPKLTLDKDIATSGTLNANVYVPLGAAESVHGYDVKIVRYVVSPRGVLTRLSDTSTGFIPKEAGVYTIRYMLIELKGESAENVSIVDYTVNIK